MKKVILALVLVLLFASLFGCGSETVRIEAREWKLTLLQSNEDGSVIGCGPAEAALYGELENLTVVELTCSAKDGSFTLTDVTNQNDYCGTYRLESADRDSTVYSIVTAHGQGRAVAARTTYASSVGGTEEIPTLVLTVGNYVLSFQAT